MPSVAALFRHGLVHFHLAMVVLQPLSICILFNRIATPSLDGLSVAFLLLFLSLELWSFGHRSISIVILAVLAVLAVLYWTVAILPWLHANHLVFSLSSWLSVSLSLPPFSIIVT